MALNDSYRRASETGMLTSGIVTADALVYTGACKVYWISVADTTADLTVELNDSTDDSGTDRWGTMLDISATNCQHFLFDPPIELTTGLWIDCGTSTAVITAGYGVDSTG